MTARDERALNLAIAADVTSQRVLYYSHTLPQLFAFLMLRRRVVDVDVRLERLAAVLMMSAGAAAGGKLADVDLELLLTLVQHPTRVVVDFTRSSLDVENVLLVCIRNILRSEESNKVALEVKTVLSSDISMDGVPCVECQHLSDDAIESITLAL